MKFDKKTLIIGGITLAVIAGVVTFFVIRRKNGKNNDLIDPSLSTSPSTRSQEGSTLTEDEPTPPEVLNSKLYKESKDTLDYINGTLDMMKLKGGEIVSSTSGKPYSVGILQYNWLVHNKEFNKVLENMAKSSNAKAKPYVQKMLNETIARNTSIFDPKKYNYEANWYLEYKAKGGKE